MNSFLYLKDPLESLEKLNKWQKKKRKWIEIFFFFEIKPVLIDLQFI